MRPGWGAAPPPTNAFLGISRRGARTDNGVQGLHPLLAGDSVETTAQLSVKASCAADASHSVDVGDDTSAARQQPNGEVKPEVMYLTEHKRRFDKQQLVKRNVVLRRGTYAWEDNSCWHY